MRRADRALLLIGLFALLGTAADHLPAFGITPMRRPISVGATPTPTPTPRPTSIALTDGNSSACGNSNRYFGSGIACSTTRTDHVVSIPDATGTVTSMRCTQSTDSTCDFGFTLNINNVDYTDFYCHCDPDSGGSVCPCTVTPVSGQGILSGSGLTIKTTDVDGACGTTNPSCVLFYTVP